MMELKSCHVSVGTLRKKLEGLPDDMPVLYQRIEDVYFDDHGWTPEKLLFQQHDAYGDDYSDYVPAFNAFHHKIGGCFVLEAHY